MHGGYDMRNTLSATARIICHSLEFTSGDSSSLMHGGSDIHPTLSATASS